MGTGWSCWAILLAAILVAFLSSCVTPAVEAPKKEALEPLINSLALEQCIGENGQAKCTVDGN